jgi:hypothetical protein
MLIFMLIFMLEIRRLVGPDVPIVPAVLLALPSPGIVPLRGRLAAFSCLFFKTQVSWNPQSGNSEHVRLARQS